MTAKINEKEATGMGAWVLLGLELACVAAVVYGVWLLSQPWAFVIGGILGVVVVERAPGAMTPEPRRIRQARR